MKQFISVPSFKPEDLAPLLDDVEPERWQPRRAKKFALDLLEGINRTECSLARLGWLALWARTWQLLIAADELPDEDTRLLTMFAYRAQLELDLHAHLIIEPAVRVAALSHGRTTGDVGANKGRIEASAKVVNRVAGFSTWCLYQDRLHLRDSLRYLNDLWDGTDARELADDPNARALYVAMYGDLETENQHVLDRQRSQHERALKKRLEWVDDWLRHKDAKPWLAVIRRETKPAGSPFPSVFVVLGAQSRSVKRRLADTNIGFLYPLYGEASQRLHGSTIANFLRWSGEVVAPDFGDSPAKRHGLGRAIADSAVRVIFGLSHLKGLLWPRTATQ